MKYAVFIILILSAGWFLLPNFEKKVTVLVEAAPCEDTPTLDCLKEFLTNNPVYSDDSSGYGVVENLARAGLYELAENYRMHSTHAFTRTADIYILLARITDQALLHPDKVADLSAIEEIDDPDRQAFLYLMVVYSLQGLVYEGNTHLPLYVGIERKHFRPNATWFAVLEKWEEAVDMMEEPKRSREILNMVYSGLNTTDDEKNRIRLLKKIKELPDSHRRDWFSHLITLNQYDGMIEAARSSDVHFLINALLAKAKMLVSMDKKQEAYPLIQEAKAKALEQDFGRYRFDYLLDTIRTLSLIEEKDEAIKLAQGMEQAKIESKSDIFHPEAYQIAMAYREAGALEKARQIMQTHLKTIKYKCTMVADPEARRDAIELYQLGMIKEAQERVRDICHQDERFVAWSHIYRNAFEAGTSLPDMNLVLADLDKVKYHDWYTFLTALYLNADQLEQSGEYLKKAAAYAHQASSNKTLCDTGILAYYNQRIDLIDGLIKDAIYLVNNPPHRKRYFGERILLNMMRSNEKPYSEEYRRYRNYAYFAGCFHQITIQPALGYK